MLQKVHYQDDHPETVADYKFQLIDNLPHNITKSASDAIGRDVIRSLRPDSRHFGLHVVAMGSEESVGANRNGDAFPEAALREFHPTFVKRGHFYREHRNRCPETQGIGFIKHSAYSDRMNRIELFVWGDKEKAEEEYEMAKAGKEMSFSMSTLLPWDECNCCMNKAATRADYCGHLKYTMGQHLPEFNKYAYTRNYKDLKFYDISKVGRPADRIAHYLHYVTGDASMQKAASDGTLVISGAEWAEFEGLQLDKAADFAAFTAFEHNTLQWLAGVETQVRARADWGQISKSARHRHQFKAEEIDLMRVLDTPAVLGELLKRASSVLCFEDFCSLVTGETVSDLRQKSAFCCAMENALPDVFNRLLKMPCRVSGVETHVTPNAGGCGGSYEGDVVGDIFESSAATMGLEDGNSRYRIQHMEAPTTTVIFKTAASAIDFKAQSFYEGCVDAYGIYLVKSAHKLRAQRADFKLLGETLVGFTSV